MAQEYPVSPAQSTASFLPGTRFHIHGGSPRSGAPHHPLLLGNDFPGPHAWAMRLGSRRAARATAARGWFSKASPGNGNCPFPTICGRSGQTMERSARHAQTARAANLRRVRAFRSILPHRCQGLYLAAHSRLSASRGRFVAAGKIPFLPLFSFFILS